MHDKRRRREKVLVEEPKISWQPWQPIFFGLITTIVLAVSPWTFSGIAYTYAKIICILAVFTTVFEALGNCYSSSH